MKKSLFFVFLISASWEGVALADHLKTRKDNVPKVTKYTKTKTVKKEKGYKGKLYQEAKDRLKERVADLKRIYPEKHKTIDDIQHSFSKFLEKQNWTKNPEASERYSEISFEHLVKTELGDQAIEEMQNLELSTELEKSESKLQKAWKFLKSPKFLVPAALGYLGYELFSYLVLGKAPFSGICTLATTCANACQNAYSFFQPKSTPELKYNENTNTFANVFKDAQVSPTPHPAQKLIKEEISLPHVTPNTRMRIIKDTYEQCSNMKDVDIYYNFENEAGSIKNRFIRSNGIKDVFDHLENGKYRNPHLNIIKDQNQNNHFKKCLFEHVEKNIPDFSQDMPSLKDLNFSGVPLFDEQSLENLKNALSGNAHQNKAMKFFEGFKIDPKDFKLQSNMEFIKGNIGPDGKIEVTGPGSAKISKLFENVWNLIK